MKKIAVIVMLMAGVLALSACNTVRGVGQDIEKGGEAIQKAVK